MNILFTNIGRRNYLVEFAKSIIGTKIFVSDSDQYASAVLEEDITYIQTPWVSINPKSYLEFLLGKCLMHKIDLIIPLMDFELPILSLNKEKFKSNGILICISDNFLVENTLNKIKTYNQFSKFINIPKVFEKIECAPSSRKLIKKKIMGSGSFGMEICNDKNSIINFSEGKDMLQLFIEGDEFGMDILNDLNGNFVHASFRRKNSMRSGETDQATTFFDKDFWELAIYLSKLFKHVGNIDIDLIKEYCTDRIYIIDVNPRFGGGYPFTHMSGHNYLKAIMDMHLGNDYKIKKIGKNIRASKGIKVNFSDY